MAGRSRAPGEARRDHRTTERWTDEEFARLKKAQESMGVDYLADLIRILALNQLGQVEAAIRENVAE